MHPDAPSRGTSDGIRWSTPSTWVMKVVRILGRRNAGKTTLAERLVGALSSTSRVATVKSIHHEVEIDTPGKDTFRHREAGAETVVGITPSYAFTIEKGGKAKAGTLDRVLTRLAEADHEFVVVEGFTDCDLPAIVVGDMDPSAVEGTVLEQIGEPDRFPVDTLVDLVHDAPDWAF